MDKKNVDRAISPVIGVVLLVALTVGLVSVASVIFFDVGESTFSTSPDIKIENIQVSSGEVQTTIIENQNVDELYLINEQGEEIGVSRVSEVGETYIIDSSIHDFDSGERISVVVVMNDNDSILTTFYTSE